MARPRAKVGNQTQHRAAAIIVDLLEAHGEPDIWTKAEDVAMRAIEQIAIDAEHKGYIRGYEAGSANQRERRNALGSRTSPALRAAAKAAKSLTE